MKNKKIWLVGIMPAITITNIIGQAVVPAQKPVAQLNDILFWLLMVTCVVVFLVAILFIVKTNQLLYNRLMELEFANKGIILPQAVAQPEGESLWENMRKKYWNNPIPIEQESEITFNHAYDGIRELDNRLPPWWVNMFVLTIIWAAGYMWYYHFSDNGLSSAEEYQVDMEISRKAAAVALAGKANSVDESSVTVLSDVSSLEDGERVFKTLCAACHGQSGEGTVGPNFTDAYWIHGGGIKNVFKTIKYGVPEKGMISWETQLKPIEMQKVASYILGLEGGTPANPKAPQGQIWKETAQDTVKTSK